MAKFDYSDEKVVQLSEFLMYDIETARITVTDNENEWYDFNLATAKTAINYYSISDPVVAEDMIDWLISLTPDAEILM